MTTFQQPVRMKRLTLDLSEPLHRAIKKNAAEEGVTMAQKLRAILAEKYHFTEETP
jgi:predicted DNA binding CopG/RHH family protein